MSFRRPTAAGIATKQGLLDILVGLYDRIEKPSGGNLTEFIKTVVNDTITGTGGGALADFASSDLVSDKSGAEWVAPEFTWPFNAAAIVKPTLTLTAVFYALSAGGTASFYLRLGGTMAADGVVVGATAAVGAFATKIISGTVPNPGGIVPVKLSIKSSASGTAAQIRGVHLVVN